MDVKVAFKKLQETEDFKKWKVKNKNTYFSYAFKIPQEMSAGEWQLGFYNKKKDKITTFVLTSDNIKLRPEEDVFKKEDADVKEVNLTKVAMTFDNAISKANEFQQNFFPKDRSIKTIAILQNIEGMGNIWNITYVTESFNTLNMKIDASSGKVIEHNLTSILSFKKA